MPLKEEPQAPDINKWAAAIAAAFFPEKNKKAIFFIF
jgi:hypothetical protein